MRGRKTLNRAARRLLRLCGRQKQGVQHVPSGLQFCNSVDYWDSRYRLGGTSGDGSYGHLAEFKASFLNSWVCSEGLDSVIEFGCGDGNQLSLCNYKRYIGLDVSPSAIKKCKARFAGDSSKSFFLYDSRCFVDCTGLFKADLTLSMDVIYHLVEDEIFSLYMDHLFAAAEQYVIIYSSDVDSSAGCEPHVRHRAFSKHVEHKIKGWIELKRLKNRYPQESCAEFVVFARKE